MSGAGAVGGFGTGSQAGTALQTTIFDGLRLTVRTTTETYPDPPTDFGTPLVDTSFLALYSTGQYVLWTYDVSATTWVAWEGAATA